MKFSRFFLILFILTAGSWLHAQTITGDGTLTFSTAGDFTIVLEEGCTADVEYEIWGGGGAGGFINLANANTPFRAAPGGSGGGYSTGTIIAQGAGTYTVTVGAGGVVTNFATTKQNGLPSSALGVTSGGGRGGGATNPGPGGTGDVIGGIGGLRDGNATSGVGGGGGGGSGPVVTNGANAVGAVGGAGGAPNGGDGSDAGGNGTNGVAPGGAGGGKGAGGAGVGGLTSGDGADGQVILIITNYVCVPLPVELTSFKGALKAKNIALEWETASEENNEGFEIQKSSNGRDWEVIDWVKGNGTTAEINAYNYLDRNPLVGDNYYRLKQIDYDGQFDFSDIVTLRYDVTAVVVEVTPNPSPGDVNVTVLNPGKEKMNIELYDSAGLLIWKSGTLTNLDTWKKKFSLAQKEMYFITVQIGKEIFTKKILIIERS